MASKGRPRKAGKRKPSGRLVATDRRDAGTDHAQVRRERFNGNGYDAIGRAFEAGLLGCENIGGRAKPSAQAQVRLHTARAIASAYWPTFGIGAVRCILGESNATGLDGNKARETWLTEKLRQADRMGYDKRRAFDQLAIDPYPDEGPAWLDRLIENRHCADSLALLDRAVSVIDRLTSD